ncbi:hypothetical protein NKH77_48275 [Streptomyces sp. M19]
MALRYAYATEGRAVEGCGWPRSSRRTGGPPGALRGPVLDRQGLDLVPDSIAERAWGCS